MGGTSPVERQKALLFMLDSKVSNGASTFRQFVHFKVKVNI